MLEWERPITEQGEKLAGEERFVAPQRACFVCGKEQWQWNGERCVCGSGDPAHAERGTWAWIVVGQKREG